MTKAVPLVSKYEVQAWQPGREIRVHKPRAGLRRLGSILSLIVFAAFVIIYLALTMLAPGMEARSRLANALGAAAGMAFLLLVGFGIVWLVVFTTGPRTVSIDWPRGVLAERVRSTVREYGLTSIRGIQVQRVEVTGEVSAPSHWCGVFARVGVPEIGERVVEILRTELLDDPETPRRMIDPYAASLAEALGLDVEVVQERF